MFTSIYSISNQVPVLMKDMREEDGEWKSKFENVDSLHLIHEFSKPSFDHVSIECSSKFYQFNLASRDLMILCLKSQTFPTFFEIREADKNFCPFSKSHGRFVDVNDLLHIEARWVKLQNTLKLIDIINGVHLSTSNDTKEKEIAHCEVWLFIMSTSHVDASGKHLSLGATISTV